MSLELLRQLAQGDQFPVPVIDEADIDKLRVLRAAGMVLADMPGDEGCSGAARLNAITAMGRATLRAQAASEYIARRAQLPGARAHAPPAGLLS